MRNNPALAPLGHFLSHLFASLECRILEQLGKKGIVNEPARAKVKDGGSVGDV